MSAETAGGTDTADPALLSAFWGAIVAPGDVHEVRIPDSRRSPLRFFRTVSGYFDNVDDFAASVAPITGADAQAVYLTLNPVNPDLLARAVNRLKSDAKATTADADIVRRRRLLIDCDPVRPTGISATDEERDRALAIRDQVREFLADLGWPPPLAETMSGNGAGLIYAVDLPNDAASTALIEGVVNPLADLFDTAHVTIDRKVCNAARITKVIGTVAATGDEIAGRRWRLATAEFAPGAPPVPLDRLHAVASLRRSVDRQQDRGVGERMCPPSGGGRTWRVADKLRENGIGFTERAKSYATVYALDRCLSSDDHVDGAAILEMNDGTLCYLCHHNRCRGKQWADVREALGLGKTGPTVGRSGAHAGADGGGGANGAADTPNTPNAESAECALPPFPIEALPPAVRRYVVAAAESIPVPAEMVAVPLLGFAGALIGDRLHLALKPSYREYLSLYLALVAPPGAAKSPALKLAQWPLDVLQRQAVKTHREQVARYEVELERWKALPTGERGEKPHPPVLRHYYSTNLTIEALVGMLERSPGVAIVRDEILSWVRSMDQYRGGKGSDRQEYLSLWSSATIKADRKGSGTVYRPYPVACVVGGIQPDFVGELHDEAKRRDGFVERLLPLVLPLGVALWTEATIDPALFGDVLGVFEALDRLPPADVDGDPMQPAGIGVALHPDAKALWVAWYDENAGLIGRAPALASGFYRKLPAHVARFALILHALWNPDDPRVMVSAEEMADAIEVGEFFRAHIDRLLPLLGAAGSGGSAGVSLRILRILRTSDRRDDDGWLPRSDILNGLRNVPATDLTAALEALRAAGSVERGARKGTTKPVEVWRITDPTPAEYSDYSDYPHDAASGRENRSSAGDSDFLDPGSDYLDGWGAAGNSPNPPGESPNDGRWSGFRTETGQSGDSPNNPNSERGWEEGEV